MMAKRSSFGQMMRKSLSDITNPQNQPRLIGEDDEKETEGYVNSLLKENVALRSLVAERNKIIEASGAELQKLRINCQKLQMQNLSLAQSNSQMLAELNIGRERMKAIQHELGCKNALLKAKHQELEEKTRPKSQKLDLKEADITAKLKHEAKNNDKPSCNKRGTLRSRSMEPISSIDQAINKDPTENKRRCVKRQSARFSQQETEPSENLFELEDVKLSVKQTNGTLSRKSRLIKSEEKKENLAPNSGTQVSQRSSLGRPLRKAAEKVQSYKEIPLKTKMRRPE